MTQRLFFIGLAGIAVTIGLICATKDARAQDCYQCAVPGGEIQGYVFNSQGHPVSGATVYGVRDLDKQVQPTAETDKNGFFRLTLETGAYRIYAGKESAGYPEEVNSVFYPDSGSYVEVQVNKDQVIRGIVLRLGPRRGRLTGRIVNTLTKSPITDVDIKFRLADNPAYSLGFNVDKKGRFERLAPSVRFTIEVSAPGYEKVQLGPLQLRNNEGRRLDISLHVIK